LIVRICVLGNSHAGALGQAWKELRQNYPGVEMVYFCGTASTLKDLVLQDGVLVPSNPGIAAAIEYTSNGLQCVELASFDLVLVYGLSFSMWRELDRRLSAAVLAATVRDGYRHSLNGQISGLVAQAWSRPIHVGHKPLLADNAPAADGPTLRYGEVLELCNRSFADEQLVFIPQPVETIKDGLNGRSTLTELSQGSLMLEFRKERANRPHPDTDVSHMNARFGRLFLRSFFRQLDIAETPTAWPRSSQADGEPFANPRPAHGRA
jgi:hypothetical protein